MTVALITLSSEGLKVMRKLAQSLPDSCQYVHSSVQAAENEVAFDSITQLTAGIFRNVRGLVFQTPCGVAVRAVSPNLIHKTRDPAVVVVDVGHRFVISLLSGHEGGANRLAVQVANALAAEPIITTTSEARRCIIAGVGCRLGAESVKIEAAIKASLVKIECALADLRIIASITHKASETGLIEAARSLGVPLRLIPADEIRASPRDFLESPWVRKNLDLPAVAEPCALLAGRRTRLVLPKTVYQDVTVALAREQFMWSESDPATR